MSKAISVKKYRKKPVEVEAVLHWVPKEAGELDG